MDPFSDLLKSKGSSSNTSNVSSRPVTPSTNGKNNDSFASLASLAGAGGAKKANMAQMSLQERLRLQSEQNQAARQQQNSSWSGLDLLGSHGGSSAATPLSSNSTNNSLVDLPKNASLEDDIFGPMKNDAAKNVQHATGSERAKDQDIDELFDVFNKPAPSSSTPPPAPAPRKAAKRSPASSPPIRNQSESPRPRQDPRDGAIAELVDMGFTDAQAREALANSDTGLDVQQAISYIMNQAHSKTRKSEPVHVSPMRKAAIEQLADMGFSEEQANEALDNTSSGVDVNHAISYLMNQAHQKTRNDNPFASDTPPQQQQQQHRPRKNVAEMDINDIGKMAQDFSATFLTKANKFWNQGRKNVVKAIDDFQHGHQPADDGTPAWMRDAAKYKSSAADRHISEEANALESHEEHVRRKQAPTPRTESPANGQSSRVKSNDDMPLRPRPRPQTQTQTQPSPAPELSRQQKFKTEQRQEEVMYSSRNRSKASTPQTSNPPSRVATPQQQKPPSRPATPKPARTQPPISPTAMDMITEARKAGNGAYTRGDYAQAATHFSQALESIPPKHLLRTVILSNRAACYMLSGDAKAAFQDADQGIMIIGAGMGAGEFAEPGKNLKDIWAKLVAKKAESSEHLEKFQQSLDAWIILMNNGYSTTAALEGRRRCQAALAPKPKPTPKPKASTPRASSSAGGPTSKAGKEAVNRVRNQHAAVEKMDTERYQLLDQVEARIAAWKGGKEDNLRALLASLDTVLWQELQWKSVGMAELVMPKKVKIAYMKAVAKTHPDKISGETSTERKMIANAVFITLNTAWDGFKSQNGLS